MLGIGQITKSIQRGAVACRFASTQVKSTYANQALMPKLPVVPLEQACAAYLNSVQPTSTVEEFAKTKTIVNEFLVNEGPALHKELVHYAQGKDNWLERWWDMGAYLAYQSPLPYRSNYFVHVINPHQAVGQDAQVYRASRLVRAIVDFKQQLDTEQLRPDEVRGTPFCMSQFARLFGHVRVPGLTHDTLLSFGRQPSGLPTRHFSTQYNLDESPRHMIVLREGHMYSLDVIRPDGSPHSVAEIEASLQKIKQHVTGPSAGVGLLTTLDRNQWAALHPTLTSLNPASIHAVNSALFVLCLDSVNSSAMSANLLYGLKPENRYFDKHQLIVAEDGEAGFNVEHAPGDGTVGLRLVDHCVALETRSDLSADGASSPAPFKPLDWNLSSELTQGIQHARNVYKSERMHIKNVSSGIGSQTCKSAKLPPDAVAQMTIQLAFYKQFGFSVSTYESASTRAFLHGRTETIRTVSPHSAAFVGSMDKPVVASERKRVLQASLLRQACASHRVTTQNATAALGCDRLFFGMRNLLRESGRPMPAIFTDPAYGNSISWRLSTSNCGSPSLRAFGFGNVADDGYGVGYFIKDNETSFTVTSDSPDMDVADLSSKLQESAEDIQAIMNIGA